MVTYTTAEVQHILHCGREKVGKLRQAGLLTGARFGNGFIYTEAEIQACIEQAQKRDSADAVGAFGISERFG